MDSDNNDNGETPIWTASQNGDFVEVVRLLMDAGALINQANNDGATPLSIASRNGHVEVVRVLIDAGALINQALNNGATPLLIASQDGHVNVVRLLINAGATVKIDTMMRYTQKKHIYS
jgi:ankyrin repeat protein